MIEDFLWVEKYRPKTVEETILPADLKTAFAKFVSNGNIPNLILTGGAGVGKSYLVNIIVDTIPTQIGICAMTGCAALLINGATLHSFLGIGLATESALHLANKVRKFPAVFERIIQLETLLIDEVSMLNDELFEKVSEFLQIIRKNKKPFGGVQMIFVGDPFQLCPVDGDGQGQGIRK